MKTDFLGRPIAIGDTVVYLQHSRSSSSLHKSKVIGLSGTTMVALESGNKSSQKLIVVDSQINDNFTTFPEMFI